MIDVGRLGVWSAELRVGERAQACEAAARLEELGYGAIWLPGRGNDVFKRARDLLSATERIVVATGIISIWAYDAATLATSHRGLIDDFPERFLLGLGVSHGPLMERDDPGRYRKPLSKMLAYLDELDTQPEPVPVEERVLAALAPRMLAVARERARGAHPYLVSPGHTRWARGLLGGTPLLAPEQTVMFERDAAQARQGARNFLGKPYINLPNYSNNWLRDGFTEADLERGGSDDLVDSLFAWGDAETIAGRVAEHHEAGADHVCVQVVGSDGERGTHFPLERWSALASALELAKEASR